MPPKHNCNQVESIISNSKDIETLQNYRKEDMAIIQEVRDDVKEIKKYLTEEIPNKYATKEELKSLSLSISSNTKSKIVWMQTYGGWIAAIIMGAASVLAAYYSK